MSNPETRRQDDKVGPNESTAGAAKGSKHDYKVGYCRPPKQHQFQRGQSGNPRGRRRQPVSKKATWEKLMNELVSLHEHMIHHFYAMAGAIPYARTALTYQPRSFLTVSIFRPVWSGGFSNSQNVLGNATSCAWPLRPPV
jgi:hypothetical protein